MFILNKICIRLFCKYIGEDIFGNQYYKSTRKDYLGNNKRYVVYKSYPEPSTVSPMWHAWLHHNSDEAPMEDEDKKLFNWQQKYEQNHTGTILAYDPAKNINVQTEKYIKWEPK